MNEMTTPGTDLVVAPSTDLVSIVTDEAATDDMIDRIEKDVRAQVLDVSTAKGRKAIASLAHKVARSKTALDSAGKELNAAKRAEIDAVDAQRRKIRERLDALKTEVRMPLDEWESAEEERVSRHKRNLAALDAGRADFTSSAEHIRHVIEDIEATEIDASWEEYEELAVGARDTALHTLRGMLAAAEEREAKETELARLRAAEEERQRKEAEERARREAEEAARRREEAAAAERERQERERREAIERAARQERDRAERAALEAQERHQRELREAKEREERAAQAERDRIAEEKRAEEEARAKREADEKHRAAVLGSIKEALAPIPREAIPQALLDGRIPYVKVVL